MRDAIANDRKLSAHHLAVVQEKKPGRSPGWTKVRTTEGERSGSMNIQWDAATSILTCRVVNRGAERPNLIIGYFVDYLLRRKRLAHARASETRAAKNGAVTAGSGYLCCSSTGTRWRSRSWN